MSDYPHSAGWKDDTTSRDAAVKIEASGRAPTLRQRVAAVFAEGWVMTADEVADYLGETIFAVRPRCSELYKLGQLERTGERRPSANGQSSHVYRRAVKA